MASTPNSEQPKLPDHLCPIDCTMTALGAKTSILILRQAFYGDRRFEAFVEHTGASEATVAKRLQELVSIDVLRKVPYREPGARERYEYELTAKGEELFPIILGLFTWGQRHLPAAHTDLKFTGPDGQEVSVALQTTTGQTLSFADLSITQSNTETVHK